MSTVLHFFDSVIAETHSYLVIAIICRKFRFLAHPVYNIFIGPIAYRPTCTIKKSINQSINTPLFPRCQSHINYNENE